MAESFRLIGEPGNGLGTDSKDGFRSAKLSEDHEKWCVKASDSMARSEK